jgi:hypothetical protein
MARHLFIVSRQHPRLYEYLVERFRDDNKVTVMVDRRTIERRRAVPDRSTAERRSGDRRQERPADDSLSLRSHLIVTVND